MSEQDNKHQNENAANLDMEKSTFVPKAQQALHKEKPQEDDTSEEIIATHNESIQNEGVDEQYGGDAADNRDDFQSRDEA